MTKKGMIMDIRKLELSVEEKKRSVDVLWGIRDRLMYMEYLYESRIYAYHILPIKFMDTVYAYSADELRKYVEWVSDGRFAKEAWTDTWEKHDEIREYNRDIALDMGYIVPDNVFTRECRGECVLGELPIARRAAAILHCDRIYSTGDGKLAFKLSDPYGSFVSQAYDIPLDNAKDYIDKMVFVELYSEYEQTYDIKNLTSCLYEAMEKAGDRRSALLKRNVPVFKVYEGERFREIKVSDMEILPFHINQTVSGEEIDLKYPLLKFVKNHFTEVETENEAISALDAIRECARRSDEVAFDLRISPTDYRVILKDRILYQFFWCNDKLCFSMETGCRYPMEREKREGFGNDVLGAKAFDFCFRDFAHDKWQRECVEFDKTYTDWLTNNKPEQYLKDWVEYEPEGPASGLRMVRRRELKKRRKQLLQENEYLCKRYCDRWAYVLSASWMHNYRDYYDPEYNTSCILCELPDYEKWRGTVFDERGASVVYYNLVKVEEERGACEDNYVKKEGRQLAWHRYYLKYGAKTPYEDLNVYDVEALSRLSHYDLDSDICIKYIGYCDGASFLDGIATVHLIDPSGDEYFRVEEASQEQVQKAVGKLCTISCLYNYNEEGVYRMLEFEILPFSLTITDEKVEKGIRIKRNLVVRGRRE